MCASFGGPSLAWPQGRAKEERGEQDDYHVVVFHCETRLGGEGNYDCVKHILHLKTFL